jgi:Brp/Blh family beta-carotene 15,15'-monooxygenase
MMRAQRVQGCLFLVCTLAVITASLILPRIDRSAELIAVASAVLLLGVPHGALDPLFVRRLLGANSMGGWAAFGVGYASLAAAVVGLWVAAPALFLAGFLLVSALHFSGDPGPRTNGFSRLIYGGAIIVVPALLHPAEMEGLFSALAGHPAASSVMPLLRALAGPWLALVIVCAAIAGRRDFLAGAEIVSVGALAAVVPPLVAFATFFCAMHSPRHILRTAGYASDVPKRVLWAAGVVPMLLVLGLVAAMWSRFGNVPVDDRLVRIMFVGLAALTVPHMVLVERVRLSGWNKRQRPSPWTSTRSNDCGSGGAVPSRVWRRAPRLP